MSHFSTFTFTLNFFFPDFTVIVAFPVFTAVITPFLLTLATFLLEDE